MYLSVCRWVGALELFATIYRQAYYLQYKQIIKPKDNQ